MRSVSAEKVRSNFSKILDDAASSHEPIHITGKKAHGVLVSEEDWRAIQETLYLLSIPKMRESIRKGLKTPLENCVTELTW